MALERPILKEGTWPERGLILEDKGDNEDQEFMGTRCNHEAG